MTKQASLTPSASVFKQAIAAFIAERREAKLKGLAGDKAAEAEAKYDYATWLADAARRVGQIQAVTHVLKATHPDARGSSLHVVPTLLPAHAEVGSHSLNCLPDDIVGNAAALDVYKFLKVEVDGRRLLDWMQQGDADLLSAMSDDSSQAAEWVESFTGLVRAPNQPQSHVLAKQIYWCVSGEPASDDGFHLLQPMFPSSLVHTVHEQLNAARFGEENKAARQAFFANEAYTGSFQSYQYLAARKLGGTKPQNISQLNSERGGVNYLLSSAPPSWHSASVGSFLGVESVLTGFRRFEGVESLLRQLVSFLKSNPPPNQATRDKREKLERALAESLACFGKQISADKPPGWTSASDCQLLLHEKLWLDPDHPALSNDVDEGSPETEAPIAESVVEFVAAAVKLDWPDEVAEAFALWLNAVLSKAELPVGDVEVKHWARQALIDAEWPAAFRRKFLPNENREASHV